MTAIIITAAAPTAAAASAAVAAIVNFGARLVYVQGASADFLAIQSFNRFLSLAPLRHLNKAEAPGPSCGPVSYY